MWTRIGHTCRKALAIVGVGMLVCAAAAVAQGAAVVAGSDTLGPAFEVAVIRPTGSVGRGWTGTRLDASGRFEASNESLNSLVWQAYPDAQGKKNVTTERGAPKWVDSEMYDINAKVDDAYMGGWDKLSDQQRMDLVRPMILRLLADRFRLKLSVEMRKTPVYVLVQAKGGAHVKEVPAAVELEGDPNEAIERWMEDHPGKGVPGRLLCSGDKCTGNAVKMSDVVEQIAFSSRVDRMVIDETGLTGFYDLSFTMPQVEDEGAMREIEADLGMRFERRSMPVKTYVIESAQKPSVDGA